MMTFGHNTMTYPDQDYRYEEGMRTPTDSTPTTKKNRLHSIDYLIGESGEEARGAKRPRPTLFLSVNAPAHDMSYQDSMMSPYTPQSVHGPAFQTPQTTPREEARYPSFTSLMSPNDAHSQIQPKFVWETVLVTGNFPDDLCLSETPSGNKANESSGQPVKQGRWTDDEKEFAEALIQQVRNGEVMLPPNVSLRKFIADSLQCKAMRVSKKFRNLKSCQSPQNLAFPDGRKFNPLSLHSIMNTDATMEGDSTSESDVSSPKKGGKTLKRSDYSQHGAVRSGRWSVEEENYAKAMIEAFKAGYLPLHGNVSLRKFLSETLVCHPMRISKKFVGYVRKYHWYRIAAGKCDPEAKRQALERLCVLEREFWMSLQQSQEWTTMQQTENRR
ncbi:hypothetical protein Poli38472_008153 [Pythium oligandrum]|uniref:Uncharacterized protein n=1 Tax=Pythium oligandrum TaxID=41045 RepID=A0A8K1CKX3_PYTOL|nr:hypothetical protein Poli38472_008153 [Pythium oligandrum]|eukprot:TMW65511.1 hypothetical protein Poli38472_008153 [Pythium oligandrum]